MNSITNVTTARRFWTRAASACMLAGFALAAQSAIVLQPLALGPETTGDGLAGTWYKVDDNAKFSTAIGKNGEVIMDTAWGTGIWSLSTDLPQITAAGSPLVLGTTTTRSAVSFANSDYNDWVASGWYGSWGMDHARDLAPVTGMAGCALMDCQHNYAAVFSGYLYVPSAGLYDLGVFSDDGFRFTLQGGAAASLSMGFDSLVWSKGRVFSALGDENQSPDGLLLAAGYYGITLDYFNRLQAGVIELSWRQGDGDWQPIAQQFLFDAVPRSIPEPGTAALLGVALACFFGLRLRLRARQPSTSTQSKRHRRALRA